MSGTKPPSGSADAKSTRPATEPDDVEDTTGIEPGPADEAEDRAIGGLGAQSGPTPSASPAPKKTTPADDDDEDDDDDAGPHSLDEWRAHFATLDGQDLWDKALQANSIRFVRQLQSEGRSATDVHQIFIALAQRFDALEQHGPDGGLYDWDALLKDGQG